MSIFRICMCGVLWLVLLAFGMNPARAEVSLTTTGFGSLVDGNVSRAEKTAFDDALFKAYLETALRFVPGSSSMELARVLKTFVSSRGNQDVVQYKIVSRSQLDAMLILSMDMKINETPLREWLQGQVLTTPLDLRPRIILVITTRGPGLSERHEWWTSSTPKGYSPFETQLAKNLREAGENVAGPPSQITKPPAGPDKAIILADATGADLVITGLLSHKSIDATMMESRLDLSLMDSRARQRLTSTSTTLKGTVDEKTMHDLLITAVMGQLREGIAKKVVRVKPAVSKRTLCIEGIRDNDTYQAIIAALRSMAGVSSVTISRVQGHTACHILQIQGNLQDVMESLRQRNIVPADMIIEGDTAYFRILNQ